MRYSTISHHLATRLLASFSLLTTCLSAYADAEYKLAAAAFKADRSADAELLRAVHRNDLDAVIQELDKGGDPNKIYGRREYMWSMCAATDKGREQILRTLITYGGGPNLANSGASDLTSLPLVCSALFGNAQATDVLLSAGADPTKNVCMECSTHRSPLDASISMSSLESAQRIFYAVQPTETDLTAIKRLVARQKKGLVAGSIFIDIVAEFEAYLGKQGIVVKAEDF